MLSPSFDENFIKKIKSNKNLINKNSFSNKNIKSDSLFNVSKISNESTSSINNNKNNQLKNENNKVKKFFHEQSQKHPKCSSCTHKYENILYKNKSALSNFIINNAPSKKNYFFPNIKLLGNSRYKHSSPFLFVEDQKNNMTKINFGLIPIPLEKFKKRVRNDKDEEEEKNLYKLQRSIVMSRRFQYNNDYQFKNDKNIYYDDFYKIYMNSKNENDFINKVTFIQRWWKKYFIKYIYNNKIKLDKLSKAFKKVEILNAFNKLKNYLLTKKCTYESCYINKYRYKVNFHKLIKKIQSWYRKYYNFKKFINKSSFISKLYFNKSFEYYLESIKNIQKNYRLYQEKKFKNNYNNSDKNIKTNNVRFNLNNKNYDEENFRIKENKNINKYNLNNHKGNLKNKDNKNQEDNFLKENIRYQNLKDNKEKNNKKMNENIDYNVFISNNNKKNNSNNYINKNEKNYNNNLPNNNNKYNNLTNIKYSKNISDIPNENNIKIPNNLIKDLIENNQNTSNENNNGKISPEKDELYNNSGDNINYYNNSKNNNIIINNSNKYIIKLPVVDSCYLTKYKNILLIEKDKIKKLNYNNKLNYNKIEKMHIEIIDKDHFIEKTYKKPIINGKHFKYQYYYSNNPFSYMNVCYISKITINGKILLSLNKKESDNNKIKNIKNNFYFNKSSKRPSKQSNNKEKNESNILPKKDNSENDISLEKSATNSKRNSRISLTHLSERKKSSLKDNNIYNNKIINENEPIKIRKNIKNGFFISKEIFKQPKKNIVKIQKHIHENISKNQVLKRPSHAFFGYKNLTEQNKDTNIFDPNVKAMIILNKNRKSANYSAIPFSNSPNRDKILNYSEKKRLKNDLNASDNENYQFNNHLNDDDLEKNNLNNNLEESESDTDSAVITKIKLFYDSNEDKISIKEDNNYIIKQIDYSKEIYYISKIRRINFIKDIQKIQNLYKYHLNSKNLHKISKDNSSTFKKPKNKCCFYEIKRITKAYTDRYMFIYNPKMKYFIYLLKLFITKNVQEYTFKIIKNGNKICKKNYFGFPFYIRTIQRIMNYLHKRNNYKKKVFLFFNEIFNYNGEKYKFILNKLCFLSKNEKNKLLYSNLYTGYEENELINFLCDFSEFDKNLNNEEFITERLKQTKLNDTNIFTLVKLIDDEYEKLVKGLYCLKCFKDIEICKCFLNRNINEKEIKKNEINDNEDNIDDDDLDFTDKELNDEDFSNKRKINYFNYNTSNDSEKLLIKTKSKVNKNNQLIFNHIVSNEEFQENF